MTKRAGITPTDLQQQILDLVAAGIPVREITRITGVDRTTAYVIRKRGRVQRAMTHVAAMTREECWAQALKRVRKLGLPITRCWPWPGKVNRQGYGIATAPGKWGSQLAHRAVFQASGGTLVGADCVLHSCDNPPCCNPAHLACGTRADNAKQRDAKKRQQFGERHYRTEVPAAQIEEILSLYAQGVPTKELALKYGRTRQYIYRVVTGRRRKHG